MPDPRPRPTPPPLLLALALALAACGGDDDGLQVDPIDGPFVQVSGAVDAVFGLEARATRCRPKPALSEFEFESGAIGNSEGLHLVFKAFSGGGVFDLTYDVNSPQHVVRVSLPGEQGYRFEFFQHLRTDTSSVVPSTCRLTLASEEQVDGTRFAGTLNCTMLWAEPGSDAYDTTRPLNNFVDLVSRFDCIY